MATSRKRGKTSSRPLRDQGRGVSPNHCALALLREISAAEPIRSLAAALGNDAAIYIVGGTARDAYLGVQPKDFDCATVLHPQTVSERLSLAGLRVIETGIEHGTVTVLVGDRHVELTTFRIPGPRAGSGYSESIEEDLAGRDFTINAFAYCVREQVLVDPLNGRADLEAGVLRAVNDPMERFREDPLRILRMIRFGTAAGRSIEPRTLEAATETRSLLLTVSPERIREELVGILLGEDIRIAMDQMAEIGLIEIVLPELVPSIGFEQNEFHTEDVFQHTLTVLERSPLERLQRLAALFHDIGKPASLTVGEDGRRHFYRHEEIGADITRTAMERLRFSKQDIRDVTALVRHHMRPFQVGPSGLRRIMRDTGELFEEWLKLKRADKAPILTDEEFEREYDQFQILLTKERERTALPEYGRLAVNGDDLKDLGVPFGPAIGKVLRALEEIVIENPERNEREVLLKEAARIEDL